MQPSFALLMQGMLRLPSCWACKPFCGNICRDKQAKVASFLKVHSSPDSPSCTPLGLCVYSQKMIMHHEDGPNEADMFAKMCRRAIVCPNVWWARNSIADIAPIASGGKDLAMAQTRPAQGSDACSPCVQQCIRFLAGWTLVSWRAAAAGDAWRRQ